MKIATLLLMIFPILMNAQNSGVIEFGSMNGDTLTMKGHHLEVDNSDEDYKFVWELEKNGDIVETYMESWNQPNLMILLPDPGNYSIVRKTYFFGPEGSRSEVSNRVYLTRELAAVIE